MYATIAIGNRAKIWILSLSLLIGGFGATRANEQAGTAAWRQHYGIPRPSGCAVPPPPTEAFTIAGADVERRLSGSRPCPPQGDRSKSDEVFTFDAFRVNNGQFVEHGDGAMLPSAPPQNSKAVLAESDEEES